MNEAAVRLQVSHALRAIGYWPITQTDLFVCRKCRTLNHPPKGRPDLLCLHPAAASIVVEVKVLRAGATSFSFGEISEEQREWLDRWRGDAGYGYIALGIIRQHGKVQKLDHLFVVDWVIWKRAEDLVIPFQASIPFCAERCRSKALKERHLTILEMFSSWPQRMEMTREDGIWRLPDGHSAYPRRVT